MKLMFRNISNIKTHLQLHLRYNIFMIQEDNFLFNQNNDIT